MRPDLAICERMDRASVQIIGWNHSIGEAVGVSSIADGVTWRGYEYELKRFTAVTDVSLITIRHLASRNRIPSAPEIKSGLPRTYNSVMGVAV